MITHDRILDVTMPHLRLMRSRVLVVLLVPVLFIATWASPTRGDFESASAAYRNQNYAQAFDEFRKLAESGDPRAQSVLAIMYKYGEGVPLDPGAREPARGTASCAAAG